MPGFSFGVRRDGRSGSRYGSCRCPPSARAAPPAGSGGSSSARRGSCRPSPPCGGCGSRAAPDRSARSPPRGSPPQQGLSASVLRAAIPIRRPLPDIAAHLEQPVAVRREGADRRGAGEAVRRRSSARGKAPARYWPCGGRPASARRPRRTLCRPARRGRRIPIPPRSAAPRLPRPHRPRHPRRRRVRRGGRRVPRRRCRALPAGASRRRASRPTNCGSRRVSTGPSVMRKTRLPGTSISGSRAGILRRVQRPFGDGDVAGRRDEGGEFGIRHRRSHPSRSRLPGRDAPAVLRNNGGRSPSVKLASRDRAACPAARAEVWALASARLHQDVSHPWPGAGAAGQRDYGRRVRDVTNAVRATYPSRKGICWKSATWSWSAPSPSMAAWRAPPACWRSGNPR